MNILFIVSTLTGGGAERVCASVANGLLKRGHDITILTSKRSELDYYIEPSIEIIISQNLENHSILSRLYNKYKHFRLVRNIIKRNNIDVVVNILNYQLLASIFAVKTSGRKIIFSDHNSYERPKDAPMIKSQRIAKFYESRLCDLTTVLTNRDKEILLSKGRKNVKVMPNPLFLPISKNIYSKEKTILAVGRLDVWYIKGFDLLIKGWASLCNEYPEWQLKIIGSGSENSKKLLLKIAEEYQAKRFTIQCFTNNIAEEYSKSEVFVLSSRYEGFGLVLTEAMSQHCACIACDFLSRQKDIVTDGVDGLICNNNLESLTEKIKLVLYNDDLRHSLQKHSIDNLDRFSEDNIAMKWETIFNELISNKSFK